MGDVPLPEANDNEACIQRITDFYKPIDAAVMFEIVSLIADGFPQNR